VIRIDEVKGLAEMDEFLKTLPDVLQRKMLVTGLRAAGKPILEQAKQNVRSLFGDSARYSGVLEEGLVIAKQRKTGLAARVNVKTRKPRGEAWTYINGVRKPYGRDPFYGRFLEKGTSKMAPKPFLAPAGYSRQTQAGQALNASLQKQMLKWCKANGVKYQTGAV
jgi:HK97 gp10 family phage protein